MPRRAAWAQTVLDRREAERLSLIGRASRTVDALPPHLGVRAAVVFGSVARGDFNTWSDVDLLVVSEHWAPRHLDRPRQVERVEPGVELHLWTPGEYRERKRRGDPITHEAEADGVFLLGSPATLLALG